MKYKWKPKYLRCYDDGAFEIFSDKIVANHEVKLNLKEIHRYLLLDNSIRLGHVDNLPKHTRICLMAGYPKDYLKEKIKYKWILFDSESDQK